MVADIFSVIYADLQLAQAAEQMNQQELLPIASLSSTAAFSEILKGHQLPSQMFIVEVGTYHQA